MKLSYLKTLQRAWDRYSLKGGKGTGPPTPLSARPREYRTEEQKVAYLTGFMQAHKLKGTTIVEYEDQVGLSHGNVVTYTKWLMTGRLTSVKPGELLDFFTARWESNKVTKREITYERNV